jgi:hypothetical protein
VCNREICEKRLKGAKGGKNDANRLAFAYIENRVLEGGGDTRNGKNVNRNPKLD